MNTQEGRGTVPRGKGLKIVL
ncbi:hypothetical protein Goari_020464 [Gossypium aridum]|uniref:Uncharacterized protein n=1 Tax=Gossypium aridum TaxID=34290 RepID=A0A7J8YPK4_GOSAI|nr:hypothetical protein [Gossypium aridum]